MKTRVIAESGPTRREVLWARRGLAVTAAVGPSAEWTITHIPSGGSVLGGDSYQDAITLIRIAWVLTDTVDWRLFASGKELRTTEARALGAFVDCVREMAFYGHERN